MKINLPLASPAQIQYSCVPNVVKGLQSSRFVLLSLLAVFSLAPHTSRALTQPSATVTVVLSLKAPPLISKTTLSASPSPARAGSPVTVSAQVTANAGTVAGTVTFLDGNKVLATVPVASGKAATVMNSPAAGTHALTAKFSGSGKLPGSTAVVSLAVSAPAATSTTLVAQPASVMVGSPITLTGTVSAAAGHASGTVTFLDGGTVLGSQAINSSGRAQLSVTTLKQGTHRITASYGGAVALAASVSSPAMVSVTARPAAPVLHCSGAPSSINVGDVATISAVASSPAGRPIIVSFSSTEGELSANGSSAKLNTTGVPSGKVQVTCKATDDVGQTSSAVASIWINSGKGEQALTAFSFIDSIGVNIHLHFDQTPVVQDFPAFLKAIVALGIHHYRNGIDPYAVPFEYQSAEKLAAAGIKADWLIDAHDSPDDINAIYANAPNSIESFEGPNEDDVDAGPVLATFTQMLHATVHSNPHTAKVPIYAPTLTDLGLLAKQSSLGPYTDYGNMHDYYYPRYPETPAYGGSFFGCGAYGTMAFNICVSHVLSPGTPVVSTETGFTSGTQSDEVLARYITRTLFLHVGMGVMRTYLYEFVDDSAQPGYGLMRSDFTPKPAYTAIQNLVKLFGDVSYATPGKFEYTLGGSTSNLRHVLFQKSDGTYMMALWLGVRSASEVAPYQNLNIPSQTVSISTATPIGPVTIYAVDDEGKIASSSGETSGSATPITVTDRVTIVSFAPAH